MLQFSPISSCKRWFEVILRRIYYVMSCVRPQPGADCFHPKWAVDSSYSWNVHCFQIRWCICHSVGIGMKGSSRNVVNAAMSPVSIVTSCSRRQKYHQTYYPHPIGPTLLVYQDPINVYIYIWIDSAICNMKETSVKTINMLD